jgi:hypothetical protein
LFTYLIPVYADDAVSKSLSKITIEHAEKTTSLKDPQTDNTIISFTGNVVISVEQDEETTTISADMITYDRTKNMMYANGNVSLVQKTSGVESESIKADSVLFNTQTQEGAFYNGQVTQEQQDALTTGDESSLIIFSNLFGRDEGGSVTFDDASLTFCDEDPPHWKIKASRIWLLSGSEFAFANALLYVGEIPVMYFPFFYYPKDEMIFNPVLGYTDRKGYYVQTTSYVIGRKPLAEVDTDDDSGFDFLKSTTLKEQERQGLFLHNLNETAQMPKNNLKIMADYYSTLGGMVGVEGNFDSSDFFTATSFSARVGFSNTVFYDSSLDAYINTADSGTTYYDRPWLFGIELPCRFATDLDTGIKFTNGSLSFSMPLYSDSYFDTDFDDRSEDMAWIDYLLDQTGDDDDDDYSDDVSGFTWKLSGNYTPKVTKFNPWLTKLSISSFSSSMTFSSTDNDSFSDEELSDSLDTYSPEREFFYVSSLIPLDFSISIAGTALNFPLSESKTTDSIISDEDKEAAAEKKRVIESLNIPENITDEKSEETDKTEPSTGITLPEIDISTPKSESESESTYSLTWTVKPDFDSDVSYSSEDLTPESASLDDPKYSYITVTSPIKLSSSAKIKGSWLSFANSVSFTPEYQTHPYLSDDYYTDTEEDAIVVNDYAAQEISLTNTNSITFKPFIFTSAFSDSSITWNNEMTLLESDFIGTADSPEWEYNYIGWDDDYITTHNLKTTLSVLLGRVTQTLSVTASLPPETQSYDGSYKISTSEGNLNFSSGYDEDDDGDWTFDPFSQSFSYVLFNTVNLAESYEYNIEDDYNDSFSLSASWNGLKISYDMEYEYSETLDEDEGWITSDSKSFLPDSADISYSSDFRTVTNKSKTLTLTPQLTTSLSADFICPTDSVFTFKPSFEFKINDFVSLTFSSESTNEVLLRYIQNWAQNFSWYTLPDISGEENIFIDLFNSFAFWDESKREDSGFKLSDFSISLEHNLHDWTMKSEFEVSPQLITDSDVYYYDFSPYFTLSIVWNPMSSMKTVIEDEYGDFSLNP